jgi:hypothetical protein
MLYPVGKDSSVMLHLACKAFCPAPSPFPFLHIAIGWDFCALLDHRDRMAAEYGLELLVHGNDMAAPGVVASLQYALGAGRHDARVPALELHQARHLDLHPGRGDPVRAALSRGRSADRVWLTGLPGAGKSTIANIVERKLVALGRQRDPKGLCAKADSGKVAHLTGRDQAYEAPEHPDLVLRTTEQGPEEAADRVIELVLGRS